MAHQLSQGCLTGESYVNLLVYGLDQSNKVMRMGGSVLCIDKAYTTFSMHFQHVTQCPVMPLQYPPHWPAFSLLHPVFNTSEPHIVAFAESSQAFFYLTLTAPKD